MTAPWVLLIAIGSLMPEATRIRSIPELRVTPRTVPGSIAAKGPIAHSRVKLPQFQMVVAAGKGDELPELWPNVTVVPFPQQRFGSNINRISEQMLPPTVIYAMDTRQLLSDWTDSFMDPFPEKAGADPRPAVAPFIEVPGLPAPYQRPRIRQDEKALVLRNMRIVIARATGMFSHVERAPEHMKRDPAVAARLKRLLLASKKFEMMALIPKDFEVPFLESGSSAVDTSVHALGLFSREKLEDDRQGSFRRHIEQQYGKQKKTGRSKRKFDVFSIEGLAGAPDLDDRLARVLLSRLTTYARKERMVVVVSKGGRTSANSKDIAWSRDLTNYYVRLGFEKLEMRGRSGTSDFELVYTGSHSSDEDMWVGNQQIMVGMNLWTGL